MRRVISFILLTAIMLSLVACGNQPNSTPDETTPPAKEIQWELKDDVVLDIPEMEIEQITFNDSAETFEIIKDPFNFNIENAKTILASEYDMCESHWNEYVSTTDDEIDGDYVFGYNYKITEYETGFSKKDNAGITVQTTIDTTISNNASRVNINFFDIKVDIDRQQKSFETVKGLLGEAWATYLIYGKDSDGLDQFDEKLKSKYALEDFVQVGSIKLLCSRDVKEDSVNLRISVESEGFNYCTINHGNYVSKYDDTFKYRLESVFPTLTDNYKNCDNVYADFFALNNADKLPNSRIDGASYSFTENDDSKSYYVSIDAIMYDKNDVSAEGDEFSVAIDISEDNNGEITDILVRAYGFEKLHGYEDMSEKEMLAVLKPIYSQKISYLLQNIKLFDNKWKVGDMQTFEDTHELECIAEELDYILDIAMNPEGDFSWNVQLTLPQE